MSSILQKLVKEMKTARKRIKRIREKNVVFDASMSTMQTKINTMNNLITNYSISLYNGSNNNINNPLWGTTNSALIRKSGFAYGDGISTLAIRGTKNPNPRVISNAICKQTISIPNTSNLTDITWLFGQLVDHELDLTTTGSTSVNINTDPSDINETYPDSVISFTRSNYLNGSNPRLQPNNITSYIDGSSIYGSSIQRNHELRLFDGSGKLKTSLADNNEILPPLNINGFDDANTPSGISNATNLFLVGDVRGNENIYLTAMHTLFVREHNRQCDLIVENDPTLIGQDEIIFQNAKTFVVATLQSIIYNEFLPALIGNDAIPTYIGYDPTINVGITTEFSTACYRVGHTMLSSSIMINNNGDTILLRNAFFNPSYVMENGIDNLLIGVTKQICQQIDGKIVDDVRNFLFGSPEDGHLLDLATLNIQRGRDHGLPGYNAVRLAYGLTAKTLFSDITSNSTIVTNLTNLYDTPNDIDPWVGAIVEDHHNGTAVGELIYTVLVDQFTKLRNGDRFWYQNNPNLTYDQVTQISSIRLSDVIRNNTQWTTEIADDVFHL